MTRHTRLVRLIVVAVIVVCGTVGLPGASFE